MTTAQSSASPRPRIALATGANKGIGRAITAGLLGESFVVYLGARDTARGATAAAALSSRGDVRFVQLDVTSAESVDAATAHVSTDFGYLDVLVNNAGVSTGSGRHIDHIPRPTEETADDLWFVYETNVFAVVRVTNAFLPPGPPNKAPPSRYGWRPFPQTARPAPSSKTTCSWHGELRARPEVIPVTGANSGIGLAAVAELARRGPYAAP